MSSSGQAASWPPRPGPMLAGGIFDPGSIARAAEKNGKPAVDLVHGLLGGKVFHLLEKFLDFFARVLRKVLRGDDRRRRIGNRFDVNPIELAAPFLEYGAAAITEERFRQLGGFFRHGANPRGHCRSAVISGILFGASANWLQCRWRRPCHEDRPDPATN